ncbi:hypothetical protein IPN41_00835 [Candidatus Falkowbacteria bacterium]|nr:MAG: hypothetical protein IPN41_00835 [Candidatus Falkowbacteria bacterium]
MKNIFKNVGILLLAFIFLGALFSLWSEQGSNVEVIGFDRLTQEINNDFVKSLEINGEVVNITLKDDSKKSVTKEPGQPVSELLSNLGVAPEKIASLNITVASTTGARAWAGALLPYLIPFILLGLFFVFYDAFGAGRQ